MIEQRGRWQPLPHSRIAFAKVQPSWLPRQRGSEEREMDGRSFREDLVRRIWTMPAKRP